MWITVYVREIVLRKIVIMNNGFLRRRKVKQLVET
jgi:hypothetical protein